MIKRHLFSLLFFSIFLNSFSQITDNERPYLLVVSLDAFRWDYPQIYHLPHFDSIANKGVKAKSLQSCFPTVTFPNHYSIATGLYPDHHGIVQNKFYDSDLNLTYKISDRKMVMDSSFYGGEPIWVTAEKQGVKSASFYWVGSEAKIKNIQPTYWKAYENKIPFNQRIDTLLYWLQLPENERPHLLMFYLPEPDGISHDFGPKSKETQIIVTYLDSLIWDMINKINTLTIGNKINIIIVSDHGMSEINGNRNILIDNYINPDWIKGMYGYNPTYNISVAKNCIDSVYNALKNIHHLKVWKSDNLPKRLHYGKNKRIGDIVILAENRWSISRKKDDIPSGGTHGYDNKNKDMQGIFYAIGPAFKKNYTISTFENIHLYPLMAEILKLKPLKTDGKLSKIKKILKYKKTSIK